MPIPNLAALDFLLTRRSYPARTLTAPVPDDAGLHILLTAAARVPDHGKLEPWRFIVLTKPALTRIAALVSDRAAELGHDAERTAKSVAQYGAADLVVIVVSSPKPSEKIPAAEQTYTAGAVCFGLIAAATAAGWGANWLSGWPSYDQHIMTAGFGLAAPETVAGVVHIGTMTTVTPDRPRPHIDTLTTWVRA